MEKFSFYRDPFTGIHPFTNPKRRTLRLNNYLKIILRLFALPFCFLFPKLFIKINSNKKKLKKGIYVANKSSFLDKLILKNFFKVNLLDLEENGNQIINRQETCIIFVEECKSNNKCLMKYVKEIDCDGVIGLKYSDSCIRMYGSMFWFVLYFLGSSNFVDIKVIEGSSNLEDATGLIRTKIGKKEYLNFLAEVNKSKIR